PPFVPAYSRPPRLTSDRMCRLVNPSLNAFQVFPSSFEASAPPPPVPTNIFAPSSNTALIGALADPPKLTLVHLPPLSSQRQRPVVARAKSVFPRLTSV